MSTEWMLGRTRRSNGPTAEELVELLVVADGQLDVTGHNAGLLVVAGGVSGKLKDLGSGYSRMAARYTGAPAPTRVRTCPNIIRSEYCLIIKVSTLSSHVYFDALRLQIDHKDQKGISQTHLLQEAADTGHRELKSSLGALADGLLSGSAASLSSFSFSDMISCVY